MNTLAGQGLTFINHHAAGSHIVVVFACLSLPLLPHFLPSLNILTKGLRVVLLTPHTACSAIMSWKSAIKEVAKCFKKSGETFKNVGLISTGWNEEDDEKSSSQTTCVTCLVLWLPPIILFWPFFYYLSPYKSTLNDDLLFWLKNLPRFACTLHVVVVVLFLRSVQTTVIVKYLSGDYISQS